MADTFAFEDVRPLLSPRSVAIIGASDTPGNLGGTAVGFLKRFGFPGGIYPVNPGRETVAGLPCYKTLGDLPESADLAIIAVGEDRVGGVIRECVAAGTMFGVVWAAGFGEGDATGVARQNALVALCMETGFRLLGPNCLGAMNTALPMTATFASFLIESERLLTGGIAAVGQSGGLISSCQALAQRVGIGFRYMVSTGNEAVLSTSDFIAAFAEDEGTTVIAVYVEGIRDGAKFVAALEKARLAGKPVVMIKGGVSAASARAAAAHTGALAGEGRVWDAILAEQAVVQVHSVEELLYVTLYLSSVSGDKLPAGPGVAPITFGGGFGVLAADQCARAGLTTPPLSDASRERLKSLVTPIASTGNPFDMTPMTYNQMNWLEKLPEALDVIAADDAIDTIFFQCGPQGRHAAELADIIREFRDRTSKAVVLAWPLGPSGMAEKARADGFHVFMEYAHAVNAIGKAAKYRRDRDRPVRKVPAQSKSFDWSKHTGSVSGNAVISEHECHRILRAAGLPIAAGELAANAGEAEAVAARIGFPLVMKGISPKVTHRAKLGLVALGVQTASEARSVYETLDRRGRDAGVTLDGVYLQKMAAPGVEILVSAFRDPIFGVMVSVGAGGGMTEVIDDVALARAPLDTDAASGLLGQLRIMRTAGKAPIAPLAAFVADIAQLAAVAPWESFTLEINPVIWNADGVVAVDGLLLIDKP